MTGSSDAAQIMLPIEERSAVSEARRVAGAMAQKLPFSEQARATLALLVTEAVTNIVKHAGTGKLILRPLQHDASAGIEVLALDRGGGIASIGEALRDGHSTAGSPGTGLGAMRRMASQFDLYSAAGKGTALRLALWADAGGGAPRALQIGAVCLPKRGEPACGDGWALASSPRGHALLVVDGLGHGPDAALAARTAIGTLARHPERSPAELIQALHHALRPTRGAAAAVALLRSGGMECDFCGIGNIQAGVVAQGATRLMVSHAGILGHQARKIAQLVYPFPSGALLIAHSDGLATRWRIEDYPGLERQHPALVAGVLYRDHCRERDDVTVVAVRLRAPA